MFLSGGAIPPCEVQSNPTKAGKSTPTLEGITLRAYAGVVALGALMENGWPRCTLEDCEWATIPGTALRLPFQAGQPHAILQAFMRDLDAFIEPVMNARGITDEGSWTPNNSVRTSNHNGATAFDYNWNDHPLGVKDGGWNGSTLIPGDQVPALRELLAWYEGMVFWGNDWRSPIDSMHFQLGYRTYGRENFDRVHSFIQRKIRADGYSTYRRGGVPRGGGTAVEPEAPANPIPATTGLTGRILWDLAGRPARMPLSRYEELLPLVEEMFDLMNAGTIDRRAGVLSQLYPESGALYYKREIADGSAYEGRCEGLGNCQPGDGRKYRGRGWIQLTGRSNVTGFSGWMFRQGLSPSPSWFVDRPEEIETDRNSMLASVYYLTVARPGFMALADARNIEAMTKAVNGGLNNLDGRRAVFNAALAVNANLLKATPLDPLEALLMSNDAAPSWSPFSIPGEPDVKYRDMVRAIDAKTHRDLTIEDAREGDPEAIRRLARVASGQGRYPNPVFQRRCIRILNEIAAEHPEYIDAANPGKQA